MSEFVVLKFSQIEKLEWGGEVVSTPLVVPKVSPNAALMTGISSFPPGSSASMHKHNRD
ncbi:MAG: hypothetical protein OSB67_00485 [Alphaproteobacteria bacterium]|nr:hypothetical protein [Alphaproteobacteria bacterium]